MAKDTFTSKNSKREMSCRRFTRFVSPESPDLGLSESLFSESLILAQSERWRRG